MHDLISELNAEQAEAVLKTDGPILVLAGPGSGKTRALTHKIAYLMLEKKIHPDSILAVTFTNKAAKEMKARVEGIVNEFEAKYSPDRKFPIKSPTWIGTFHSVCTRLLRIEAQHLDIGKNFVIYDSDDSEAVIKEAMKLLDVSIKDFTVSSIASAISKAKCEMLTPKKFAAEAPKSYFYETVLKIYSQYQKRLKENNALDFNDLLLEVLILFEKKPEILEKYQNLFKYILVDEYQDTNRVQYTFVKLLAEKNKNITVVGDVSQSIYSWRGADHRNMSQFTADYPDVLTLQLARNYRSSAVILEAAKSLIANNSSHLKIDLYTSNPEGAPIMLYEAENEKDEARYIAETISSGRSSLGSYEVLPDYKFSDHTVLYRTNAQSRSIEEAFLNFGIPYRIIGGLKFYDRKEVKDVLAYLKVFFNPSDTIAWSRCINTPPRKIGQKTLAKVFESGFNLDLVEKLTHKPWEKMIASATLPETKPLELIDEVLKTFGYLEYLNDGTEEGLQRIENLKELRSVSKNYESLGQFLENIALIESSNKVERIDEDTVILMTMHAAKGLEFDTVFIAGMEEGIFPHARALADPNELEEERRLCYVGITRAKRRLYMTYARHRNFYGGMGSSIISRFLSEIPEDLLNFRSGSF
jgi:DNA helicase II / ATP-dependent DNA helicase PcrA